MTNVDNYYTFITMLENVNLLLLISLKMPVGEFVVFCFGLRRDYVEAQA